MSHEALSRVPLVYPERDGKPMADNTLQFAWIVLLKENLDRLRDDFVAGDLLWYPLEGDPGLRVAPDVLVAVGRPKGYRGCYKQWEEGGVPLTVVFEVMSPNSTAREMAEKRLFYQEFQVEEYYLVDPDVEALEIYLPRDGVLVQSVLEGVFTSPRLGISFERVDGRLVIRRPDGVPFRSFAELDAERDRAEQARLQAEARTARAEQGRARAEQGKAQAEARAEALAARLRAAGIDPDEV